jgi:hypothetical protein
VSHDDEPYRRREPRELYRQPRLLLLALTVAAVVAFVVIGLVTLL